MKRFGHSTGDGGPGNKILSMRYTVPTQNIKKYLDFADFSTDPLVPLLFAEVLYMMHKPPPRHHHLNLQLAVGAGYVLDIYLQLLVWLLV